MAPQITIKSKQKSSEELIYDLRRIVLLSQRLWEPGDSLGYVATIIPLCNFDAAQTDDWNFITEKVLGFAPQKMFDYF